MAPLLGKLAIKELNIYPAFWTETMPPHTHAHKGKPFSVGRLLIAVTGLSGAENRLCHRMKHRFRQESLRGDDAIDWTVTVTRKLTRCQRACPRLPATAQGNLSPHSGTLLLPPRPSTGVSRRLHDQPAEARGEQVQGAPFKHFAKNAESEP